MKNKYTKGILVLIGLIVISQLAGILSGMLSSSVSSSSFKATYSELNQPSFSPPSWVFGPVWAILYTLMGISAYLVYKKGIENPNVKTALIFFFIQLFLNFLWSIIFFGLNNPMFAFAEIVILWGFIMAMIISFKEVSRTAAYLQIPYILWVTFAAILNLFIWIINAS